MSPITSGRFILSTELAAYPRNVVGVCHKKNQKGFGLFSEHCIGIVNGPAPWGLIGDDTIKPRRYRIILDTIC